MNELNAIKAEIVTSTAKLTAAETNGKAELILAYSNILVEQQKMVNILLTGSGNLLLYR